MTVDRTEALEMHRKAQGKIKLSPSVAIRTKRDISLAYLQGGAIAAGEIFKERDLAYEYTGKDNRLAIVSNGTSVLGLGNYGPEAALPMIEGKCLLYKKFGDIDAIPLCINPSEPERIMDFCRMLSPTFGAINVEDIKSPMDFNIVKTLRKELDIPIFGDDMHCSSVVILGSLMNALKVVEKELSTVKIVIVGAGTSAIATAELMLYGGATNIIMLNRKGIVSSDMEGLSGVQRHILDQLNPEGLRGGLTEAVKGADVLIGLTGQVGAFGVDEVKSMESRAIVFPLGRPEPEMNPLEAKGAGAEVVGCGVVEGINTMPNLKVFPGITRGLLDVRATGLNFNVLMKAAREYADNVDPRRLSADHITPHVFSDELTPRIAEAVAQSCISEGLARLTPAPHEVLERTWNRLFGGYSARY
nr:malic enzyme-like NAD(P)-binding protein [uncultured Dethiosulfovibrio sp.]